MMSLGGITLGVGMIVDNSIVVLENIFSYRADGYSRLGRLHEGHGRGHDLGHGVHSDHHRRIPADRAVGRHDRYDVQGILYHHRRVAAQLAHHRLTLVPLLCYILLGASKAAAASAGSDELKATTIVEKPLMRRYRSSLKFLITHRWAGIGVTLAICVISVASIAAAGMELIPETDQGQISVLHLHAERLDHGGYRGHPGPHRGHCHG